MTFHRVLARAQLVERPRTQLKTIWDAAATSTFLRSVATVVKSMRFRPREIVTVSHDFE